MKYMNVWYSHVLLMGGMPAMSSVEGELSALPDLGPRPLGLDRKQGACPAVPRGSLRQPTLGRG
jgi:hypothetical protein